MLFMITVIFIGILKRINSQTLIATATPTSSVSSSSSYSISPQISYTYMSSISPTTTSTSSTITLRSPSPLFIQPSPVVSAFALITDQEWVYIGVPVGFVFLCTFISIMNQHFRINNLEKKINKLKLAQQMTTNPSTQSPLRNILSSHV